MCLLNNLISEKAVQKHGKICNNWHLRQKKATHVNNIIFDQSDSFISNFPQTRHLGQEMSCYDFVHASHHFFYGERDMERSIPEDRDFK